MTQTKYVNNYTVTFNVKVAVRIEGVEAESMSDAVDRAVAEFEEAVGPINEDLSYEDDYEAAVEV